jgi:hypothetical protein
MARRQYTTVSGGVSTTRPESVIVGGVSPEKAYMQWLQEASLQDPIPSRRLNPLHALALGVVMAFVVLEVTPLFPSRSDLVVTPGFPLCNTAVDAETSWAGHGDHDEPPFRLPQGCVAAPAGSAVLRQGGWQSRRITWEERPRQGWATAARRVLVRAPAGLTLLRWTVWQAIRSKRDLKGTEGRLPPIPPETPQPQIPATALVPAVRLGDHLLNGAN